MNMRDKIEAQAIKMAHDKTVLQTEWMAEKIAQDRARFALLVKLLPLEDMVNIFCTMLDERPDLTREHVARLGNTVGRLVHELT